MSDSNGHGTLLTGADVIAKGRRVLDLPSGGRVIVGRVEVDDLAETLGGMPDVSALALQSSAEKGADVVRRPETRAVLAKMATIIRKGTIEPELFEKRKDGPTPLDFSIEDRALMFKAILELSSYSKEAAAEVLPLSKTVV